MFFTLEIIIADSSSLPNRVLMFAFATSPFIVNVWTGPEIAQAFFNRWPPADTTLGWRWGHGVWAIILPVVTAPILTILFLNQRKAKKMGIYPDSPLRGKSFWRVSKELFFELDVIGVILITAGFALVLLAITLAGYQSQKWREASIIVMLVVGFCSLIAACVWEYKFAVFPLLRWNLIKDRTVACACGIGFIFWVTFYCWDGCTFFTPLLLTIDYTSFLQVVHFTSVRAAGYIANTYSFGSCVTGIVLGFIIKFHGRYKIWFIIGIPIYILGTGISLFDRSNTRLNDPLSRTRVQPRLSHHVSNLCGYRRWNNLILNTVSRYGRRLASRHRCRSCRSRDSNFYRRCGWSRSVRCNLDEHPA